MKTLTARPVAPSLLLAALLGLSACTMGPNYQRPDVDVAPQWRSAYTPGTVTLSSAWWRSFGDPALDELVRSALDDNKDLRMAVARIEQYEARLQISQSARYPQVDANGSRQRITMSQQRPVPLPANVAPTNNQYELGYGASWEIDLWGRVKRSNEAALAELLAVKENREAVVLSLVSELVASYLNLLQLDRQLELMKARVANREAVWKLLEGKAAGGAIAALQVAQAKAVFEEARAELPLKEYEIALAENNLNFLAGRNPGPIARGRRFEQLQVTGIPAGLPSELLQQRPDIRRAEQDLIAANARIGVAKAAYFPTLSLTGGAGYASTELRNFGQLTSNFWNYGPQIAATLFDGGRIAGNVREAEARQRELVIAYQRAIQAAFREVDDALARHKLLGDRIGVQQLQIAATQEAARLARNRYEGGYSSYQEVLDAEALVLQSQISNVNAQGNQLDALIAVFRTMGGGWTSQAESLAAGAPRQ
ncbi:efflux transporter outer membrane subunit [Aquabacterium sp.]|uniref:efflux transporter outer membrane subunit n=1 Tax=Aquabacterium sp. TaxID=1872578 RepID=UPI0037848758